MSPAHSQDPLEVFNWVGIIMYLPPGAFLVFFISPRQERSAHTYVHTEEGGGWLWLSALASPKAFRNRMT